MRLQTTTTTETPRRGVAFWPDAVAYREAIQNPNAVLSDPELQAGQVVLDRRGLPLAYSGRSAVVFRLRTQSGDWAIRCFTQAANDGERRERYRAIAGRLSEVGGTHFVRFRYVERGIRIDTQWFPIVAMRWAEGETLGQWVEKNLDRPAALLRLAASLTGLLEDLERSGIAHGDWQHDNLLVSEDGAKITLVDYDGMFVPALSGRHALELGHPNYQHPARTSEDFAVGLDRFSCLALQTALLGLACDPSLWDRFSDGESILFKRGDLADPSRSPVFGALRAVAGKDTPLGEFLGRLEWICRAGRGGVLLSEEPLAPPEGPDAGVAGVARWWMAAGTVLPVEPPAAARQPFENVRTAEPVGDYLRRLTLPETLSAEQQHLWKMRALLLLTTPAVWTGLLSIYVWPTRGLPLAITLIFPVVLLWFYCSSVLHSGYGMDGTRGKLARWPVKRIYDELSVALGNVETQIAACTRNADTIRTEIPPDPGSRAGFVTAKLRKQRIDVRLAMTLPGLDLPTLRVLRQEGIITAAGLENRTDVPGIPTHKWAVLRDWRDELASKAAGEHHDIVRRRQRAYEEIERLQREIQDLQGERADLRRERDAFPDLSFRLYLRRLLGLKNGKPS